MSRYARTTYPNAIARRGGGNCTCRVCSRSSRAAWQLRSRQRSRASIRRNSRHTRRTPARRLAGDSRDRRACSRRRCAGCPKMRCTGSMADRNRTVEGPCTLVKPADVSHRQGAGGPPVSDSRPGPPETRRWQHPAPPSVPARGRVADVAQAALAQTTRSNTGAPHPVGASTPAGDGSPSSPATAADPGRRRPGPAEPPRGRPRRTADPGPGTCVPPCSPAGPASGRVAAEGPAARSPCAPPAGAGLGSLGLHRARPARCATPRARTVRAPQQDGSDPPRTPPSSAIPPDRR